MPDYNIESLCFNISFFLANHILIWLYILTYLDIGLSNCVCLRYEEWSTRLYFAAF